MNDLFNYRSPEIIKREFFADINEGKKKVCPCCGRHAQVYRRQIHAQIAFQLIKLYRAGGATAWVKLHEVLSKHGKPNISDFSITKYWGLVEQEVSNDSAKRTSGMWRLTPTGVQFVDGGLAIPKYSFIFDDTLIRSGKELTTIGDCLGAKFNYAELMNVKI